PARTRLNAKGACAFLPYLWERSRRVVCYPFMFMSLGRSFGGCSPGGKPVKEADMTHMISKLLAAALVAAGSVTALPSVSPAQGLDLYIGPGGDYDRDNYRQERRYDDEDYYRPRSRCSTGQALRSAYRYGVRDPEIASVSRNRVIVEGETR